MAMRRGLLGFLAVMLMAASAAAVDLPRKASPLTIGMNSGKPLTLDQFKGKAVLLAFISTTCPHCQYTTGILEKLQAEYGSQGLQVVEAAIDQGAEANVPGFIQRFHPNFPVGFVPYDTSLVFLQHNPMMIMYVPSMVFIDRQGTIRAEYEGGDKFFTEDVQEKNLRDQIEKLLHSSDMTRKTHASQAPAKN
jgi:thiol-disulfide isomerase/thioredoxin